MWMTPGTFELHYMFVYSSYRGHLTYTWFMGVGI